MRLLHVIAGSRLFVLGVVVFEATAILDKILEYVEQLWKFQLLSHCPLEAPRNRKLTFV